MCGFAALLESTPLDADAVESVLAMRGPDGRGLVCDKHCWLLHRRLSIIDLSKDSAQPFRQGDTTTLYNGEIYNYTELGANMGGLETTGDTEVFARLMADGSIANARGMYAGAVVKGRTLTITRDRFGIKPLYRATTDNGVAVASQLRCFPALTGDREIDPRAIASVLRFGAAVGTTMFQGVDEVAPGTTTVYDDGHLDHQQALPPVAAADLAEALRNSMQRHMVADVPVAVLLSGGLDSAVMAKLAAETGNRPTAVTLSSGGELDETDRAKRTAREYGLEHVVEQIEVAMLVDSIDDYFDAMDQPSVDGLNTFLVSKAVNKAGFKVALSGLGADELFGGYSSFRRIYGTHAGRFLPAKLLRRILSGRGANDAKVARWVDSRQSLSSLAAISREIFSPEEIDQLCGVRFEPDLPSLEGTDEIIDSEVWRYMSPMLLRDADAQSMAHSVELRVPFLDDEVVGAALKRSAIDRAVRGKRVIPTALDDRYLAKVARAPKTGFRLPFDDWLGGPLSDRREQALSAGSALGRFVDLDAARRLCATGPWSRSWILVVLNEWMIRNE